MYADDTQVYIELSQSDIHKSISSRSDCLTDISLWMKSSKLKQNFDKTEFISIGTKQQRHVSVGLQSTLTERPTGRGQKGPGKRDGTSHAAD